MSNRLDQDREKKLQPKRIQYAVDELKKLDVEIISIDNTKVVFWHQRQIAMFYPYSGWHTGKGITDGRGIKKLLNQLK